MEAYISGALMGSKNLKKSKELYNYIGNICSKSNIKAYIPHLKTDPSLNTDLSPREVFCQDFKFLKSSDIIVCYIGEPSLGVGAEVALAVQANKIIVTLIEESNQASRFLTGLLLGYERHTSIRYSNMDELEFDLGITLNRIMNSKVRLPNAYETISLQ